MFLLSKKRILFISSCIIISILSCSILHSKQLTTTITSATPISNHTIILDAGHGNPDGGATNSDGNIIEAELNLAIVLKLQNLLETSNCRIILTRSDENGIYEANAKSIRQKKISDMKNRANIANTSNADAFISIHMNKLEQSKYFGWQTFYKDEDENSQILAQNIQNNLNSFMNISNSRNIKSISGIYLTKNINIPLVIVECGFLSNEKEANLLSTSSYQDKIAWCIYTGLMDYFDKNDS